MGVLIKDKNGHFDPDLVDAFVQLIRDRGWTAAATEQPAPDTGVVPVIDHDDLELSAGGPPATDPED